MLETLRYVRPSVEHERAFADWLADWRDDGYDAYRGIFSLAWTDFAGYVALCARLRHGPEPPRLTVPLDAYFAFAGDALAGELYLFYEPMGGDNHIGYKVRPSLRRRGIASAMTRWGMERLRERGLHEARLTCLDENSASAAVIEGCGGTRREDDVKPDGARFRRYVIPLST